MSFLIILLTLVCAIGASIEIYKHLKAKLNKTEKPLNNDKPERTCVGIGLEEIASGKKKEEVFKTGDVFIVTAEPGTDKTGFSYSFLLKINEPENTEKGFFLEK